MLRLLIPKREYWDPIREKFITIPEVKVELEHSLNALSKWESKWHIPFHSDKPKTNEQNIDYVRCMCLDANVDPNVFNYLTEQNVNDISDYIQDSSTATWFSETKKTGRKDVITAEIIYYWMTVYNIPSEYEYWHLNKLLTLLRVCAEKNNTDANGKKMNKMTASQRQKLNAARKKKYHTRG